MYIVVKHIHIWSACLTVLLLMARTLLALFEKPIWRHFVVRMTHVTIDIVLVTCALNLVHLMKINPLQMEWLSLKLALLVLYILCSIIALRETTSKIVRAACGSATACLALYILGIAFNHDVQSWFS